MFRSLLLTLLVGVSLSAFSQADSSSKSTRRYTISGFITDKVSGERIIGANVYETVGFKGTTTNQFGFYSITLPAGEVKLRISFLGYQTENMIIDLQENKTLSPGLSSLDLNTVEIVANKEEHIEEKSQMSAMTIPINQIKSLPKFMGETDVLKAIQLLPGVKSGVEGTSGFYVRGGSPDQNLILLDGVPLYNVSHLFGFFSVFNGDAVSNINLIKGGFPARFGGRLSSVLEVNTKDGNQNKLKGKIGVGLISSSLMLEGPLFKDKSTFVISARRTYIDLLAQPLILAQSGGKTSAGYYFHDLNAKYTHKLDDRNKLYASFYWGNDKFYGRFNADQNKTKVGLGWGNLSGVTKLVSQHNDKLFGNYSLCYTRYKFNTVYEDLPNKDVPVEQQNSFYAQYYSVIKDVTAKAEYDYYVAPDHLVRFGGLVISHTFNPGAFALKDVVEGQTSLDTTLGKNNIPALETNIYAEDDFKVNDKLKINYGLHYSNFYVQKTFYQSLQPRISGRYLLKNGVALKASYSRMTQYIHLLSNAGLGLPTDLWVPSTTRLLPERSGQGAVGVAKTMFKDFELTVEGYYKTMSNVIEYKDGESYLNGDRDFDQKVEAGKGWSYGAEVLFQKKAGKTTGWIGYTLSWTNRQFPTLSGGKVFPYRYDRRHDISFVISHKFNDHIEASATWVFGTGNAVTLPIQIGKSSTDPFGSTGNSLSTFSYYGGSRNSFRMAPYHRADVSISFIKKKLKGTRTWNLSVYNVYNRMNPFYIDTQQDMSGKTKFVQYSLFPLIPSFNYVYEF